jgi:hypothetical protein
MKERDKLQKLKDLTDQYQNDIDKLNEKHDAAEAIRIQQKYDKQIQLAEELLKSTDPSVRKDAAAVIVKFQQEADAEIEAMQAKHLRELEEGIKKHQEDTRALEDGGNEKKLTNIRQKYAKELEALAQLELSDKPKIREQAAADRVALEGILNAELDAETDRYNDEQDKKQIAEYDKQLKERLKHEHEYAQFTGNLQKEEQDQLFVNYLNILAIAEKEGKDVTAVTEAYEKKKAEIIGKYNQKRIGEEKATIEKIKQAELDLQNARLNAYAAAANLLRGLVGEQTTLGKVLLVFEKSIAIAHVVMELAKQKAAIATAATQIAANPAFALIPSSGLAAAAAYSAPAIAAATLNAGVSIASIAATTVQSVFQKDEGGFTDVVGAQDGKTYRAQYKGQATTGPVLNPTLYLAGEHPEYVIAYPEMQNPMVANFVGAIEGIRQRRVNGYADGGHTSPPTPEGGGRATVASPPLGVGGLGVVQVPTAVFDLMVATMAATKDAMERGILIRYEDADHIDRMIKKVDENRGYARQ